MSNRRVGAPKDSTRFKTIPKREGHGAQTLEGRSHFFTTPSGKRNPSSLNNNNVFRNCQREIVREKRALKKA